MRIIDLLNKIANGEGVSHFEYDDIECYLGVDGYLKDQYGDNVEWWINKNWLNKKVEILEEENKIEKLDLDYSHIKHITDPFFKEEILMYCDNLQNKINDLIDEINKLKEDK